MAEKYSISPVVGRDLGALQQWVRTTASKLNEFIRQASVVGSFWVYDRGAFTVPTNTTITGGTELVFSSIFVGSGTLVVTGVGFSGGVHVAINGTDLGALTNVDLTSDILYEIPVTNLQAGLNALTFWDDSGDAATVKKVEAWRQYSSESSAFFASTDITGAEAETLTDGSNADSLHAHDHDVLTGFVADEHVAHTGVSVVAGAGLTGGGTIAASVTLNAIAGTGITVAADSISTNDSAIVHDNLSGFFADEHVAHTGVTLTAGNGLTGGGAIDASRSFSVGAGTGITVNADDVAVDTAEVIVRTGITTYVPTNDSTVHAFDANAAGGSISATPTQAEVENIRDAVLILADVVATLITDLGLD